jgi:hypothetical protein
MTPEEIRKEIEGHRALCDGVPEVTDAGTGTWCPVCWAHNGTMPKVALALNRLWSGYVGPEPGGPPGPRFMGVLEEVFGVLEAEHTGQSIIMRHYATLYKEAEELRVQCKALVESNNRHVEARRAAEAEAARLSERVGDLEGAMNPQDAADAAMMRGLTCEQGQGV